MVYLGYWKKSAETDFSEESDKEDGMMRKGIFRR